MKKSRAMNIVFCVISVILVFSLLAGCGVKKESNADKNLLPQADGIQIGTAEIAEGSAADFALNGDSANSSAQNAAPNYKYDSVNEQGFTAVSKDSNTSTFSLDRNTASYSIMRNQINNGIQISENSVRIEEYINYFSYSYQKPTNGDALAISGGIFDCPWNSNAKLLSVGVAAGDIEFEDKKSNNIVFLLDVSGSMYGDDRLGLIQQSFTMLLEHLDKDDTVSIVTYAGQTQVLLDGARGYEKTKIAAVLQDLEAGGSTAGAKGIELAYNTAQKYYSKDKNNRVILATDGDFNVGISSTAELKKYIAQKRDSGIYLSVFGVGMGNTSDSIMKTLAENGNGNYAYLDSLTEARKVLVNELGGTMNVVAKNAKINITFNEETVSKFRLIGYETKMMSVEEFEDENKDAGEIGEGHTVTALYEIELKPDALKSEKEIINAEIRYQTPENKPKNLKITKKLTAKDYSALANEDMTFIACVAEFGLVLRKSEYKGDASLNSVISRLEALSCTKTDEFKKEFLEIVKKAKSINAK